MITRRRFIHAAAATGAITTFEGLLPGWARSAGASLLGDGPRTHFELEIGPQRVVIEGRRGDAVTINGSIPGPLLRWREGEVVTLDVTNRLDADTSIHWHGLLLPPEMDGVPGISFPGIKPGETFRYQFPVRQSGTYWYHSHSGFQEQLGHYGPLVIEPRGADPVAFDREYVIVFSDWTFESPDRVFAKLKKMSDNYNFQRRTVGDFFRDAANDGLRRAVDDRSMWGRMRMNPTDIADVTGSTYRYLVNGRGLDTPWTGVFVPGERVRLRMINASAMSIFNVRLPDLPMVVVQADGLNVRPVEVDELQIGTAETFDVVVEPREHRAFNLMCESIDRSGYALATLTPELGLTADVPPLRQRPLLTMKDMGMAGHGGMDHGKMDHATVDQGTMDQDTPNQAATGTMDHGTMDHGTMDHGSMDHGSMDHGSMDHGSMDHGSMDHDATDHAAMGHDTMGHDTMGHDTMGHDTTAHGDHEGSVAPEVPVRTTADRPLRRGPGVDNLAEEPMNRLHEPGAGLEGVDHRVLVYTDLESLEPNPDLRPPGRELELHLTSNMERYMWSFDGVKLSEEPGPIVFHEGERLRLTLVNDTMMPHPIHLHGMFFDLDTGAGAHKPRKHTIVAKPGEKLSVEITADAVGNWAFHCHLLYHMNAGMMRVVSVLPAHGEVSR